MSGSGISPTPDAPSVRSSLPRMAAFSALGQALQVGNLQAARQAFSKLEPTALDNNGSRGHDERKRAEDFRLLVESFTEYAIFMLDPEGAVLSWNEGARRLKGYAAEEILGLGYAVFFTPEDIAAGEPARMLETARREGHCADNSWRRRKDGSLFWIDSTLVALWEPDGGLRGFAEISRDATAQHDTEERLRAADLRSEFLANMSHELRTPLNAIIGFAAFIHSGKAGPLSDEQTEYLGDVLSCSRQLLNLINGVLDLAKIEAGRLEFDNDVVDLRELVAETCESVRQLAAEKRLRIETVVEGNVRATLDAVRFKQVLYNFLSNAIKFTKEDGRIMIRIRPDSNASFRLEVEDNGIGIRGEDLSRLFRPFEQLDRGDAKQYQGTGLGLVLTKQLVEAQGGKVLVNSVFGKGSTFAAVLPQKVAVETVSHGGRGQ